MLGRRLKDLRRLRADREGKRFTQDDLAAEIDATKSAVAKWETDVQVPSADYLMRLARALNATPEYILHGTESEPRHFTEHVEDAAVASDSAEAEAGFADVLQVTRYLGGVAPPGEEKNVKLDILEGIKRTILIRESRLPDWWYMLRGKVEDDAL